jgi:hypothetical protein
MKKINFKKIFKKEISAGDLGSSSAWPVTYVRDWTIMVYLFAAGLILISFFAWQIYLSNHIGGGYFNMNIEPTSTYVRVVDKKRLQIDLNDVEQKEINFLKYKDSQSIPFDPAI